MKHHSASGVDNVQKIYVQTMYPSFNESVRKVRGQFSRGLEAVVLVEKKKKHQCHVAKIGSSELKRTQKFIGPLEFYSNPSTICLKPWSSGMRAVFHAAANDTIV